MADLPEPVGPTTDLQNRQRAHIVSYHKQVSNHLIVSALHRYQDRHLRSHLLFGNTRDGIETLTPCTEWSQFAVDFFFSII